MEGPTSHIYFSQRLRLHYVDWGNRDAPPLLMVHGGRDHCRNWDWVAEALRHEYHVIAPDLRGHGDSEWAHGSSYNIVDFVYDIAQLIRQARLAPLTILGHSMGGAVSLHYAGVYPETVRKIISIEGLGPPPDMVRERLSKSIEVRIANWVDDLRKSAARLPRRYPTLEDAYERMQAENPHLSAAQARHLTIHGSHQNEDGTYSWKFDNYVRLISPVYVPFEDQYRLWNRITCPVLLVRGTESWASDPVLDGRASHFRNARLVNIAGAGHWSHHDQFDVFMRHVREFLAE
ncbi:MAG: alpha/beta fold hydrolase [Gammaproteobacteria bacterium]